MRKGRHLLISLQQNAIRAAGSAGVERIVKVSALGATDHSRSVIGCWHVPVVFDRAEGGVRSAAGARRIPFIDTRDIPEVAAPLFDLGAAGGRALSGGDRPPVAR